MRSHVALVGQVPLIALAHTIPSFPPRSELWLRFLEAYEYGRGLTLHAQSQLASAA